MNMHESAKAQAQEKILKALFEYAAACNIDNILTENPIEDDLTPKLVFPHEFDVKMNKLIAKYNRQEAIKKIRKQAVKYLPKTAIFILVLLGSFTITVASVQAWRVKALNVILNIRDQYTSIQSYDENNDQVQKNEEKIPQDWNGYVPEYIPNGYKIERTEKHNMSQSVFYTNEKNGTIRFTQYLNSNTDIRVDTEDAMVEHIKINNSDALLSQKQGLISIVWKDDFLFNISGEADKAEIIKMARSNKIIN